MNTLFGEMTPNTGVDGKPLEATPDPKDQALVDDIPYDEEESLPGEQDAPDPENPGTVDEEDSPAEATSPKFSFLDVAEEFVEDGLLLPNSDKEYEDSPEGFREVIEDTVQARFEAEYGLPDNEHLAYLAFIKQGGSNREWLDQTTGTYEDADLDDEDTQKELLSRQYQSQGFTEAQITKKLTRLEANGALEEEAREAQEFLIGQETKQTAAFKAQVLEQEVATKERNSQALVHFQQDIEAADNLGGVPLTAQLKKALYAHGTKPVGPKGETQFQLNQGDKTRFLTGMLMDFLGLNPVEQAGKKVETQKANKLQESLKAFNRGDRTGGGQTVSTTTAPNTNRVPTKGMPWEKK